MMINQSYSSEQLRCLFFPADFFGIRKKNSQEVYKAFVSEFAVKAAKQNESINIRTITCGKNTAFTIDDAAHKILMRKTADNLKISSGILRMPARSKITKNIFIQIQEGVPYSIYRLDIKKFYESFQSNEIDKTINGLSKLSPVSKQIIEKVIQECRALGCKGLPRGIGISSIISEIITSPFDECVRSNPAVYYYSRYVDDIIIITNGTENASTFIDELSNSLPNGLSFHEAIKKDKVVVESTKNKNLANSKISYLGYEFTIGSDLTNKNEMFSKSKYRIIYPELSTNKLKKIKTRLIRSLIDFSINKNSNLFLDRVKFLMGNFKVSDRRTLHVRKSGIRYNYPLLKEDCQSLKELDAFFINSVFTGRTSKKILPLLNNKVRRKLLSHSFERHFKNETFFYFSANRIAKIKECWLDA